MRMTTENDINRLEHRWDTLPEGKLELIDGKLLISTLAGSRRILWELLMDYGPGYVLPMAPPDV